MGINEKSFFYLQVIKRLIFMLILLQIFLVLFALSSHLSFTYAFLPLLPFIFLIPSMVHTSLNCLSIPLQESSKKVFLFAIYHSSITLTVFFVLLSLKLDQIISESWGIVFIPFWYGLSIYLGLVLFLIPSMFDSDSKMIRQSVMLTLWLFGVFLSSVLNVLSLEVGIPKDLGVVLAPVLLVGTIHLAWYGTEMIKQQFYVKPTNFAAFGIEFFWFMTILQTAFILICKQILAEFLPNFVVFLPIIQTLTYWIIKQEKFYQKILNQGVQFIDNN